MTARPCRTISIGMMSFVNPNIIDDYERLRLNEERNNKVAAMRNCAVEGLELYQGAADIEIGANISHLAMHNQDCDSE